MIFFGLFAVSGFVLAFGTVYLVKRFKAEWKMPKGLYLKAGFSLITIGFFHFAVLDGILSAWPQFEDMNYVLQGIFLGVMSGLFFELGRFFILDKLMKTVRDYKEAIYFALGWNGVATLILGVMMIISTYGLFLLVSTPDLSTLFPEATADQIEEISVYQEEANKIVNENPILGVLPIFERVSLLLLDILLTLIIIVGFLRGTALYVWIAVLFRFAFISIAYIAEQFSPFLAFGIFMATGVLAIIYIRKAKKLFPSGYSASGTWI